MEDATDDIARVRIVTSLRAKYARMARLRDLHARAQRDPAFVEPDPRSEMLSLSDEYPGALREIDELPADVLRARLDALEAAERGPGAFAPWMRAQDAFHRAARGALCAKRWLGRTRDVTPSTTAAFVAAVSTMRWPEDAAAWADDLAALARPPRGRITALVFSRIALGLAITEEDARRLVFGGGRRTRA